MEEVEAVLERIWDLHDKISDAIHAISRAHFLSSVKGLRSGRQPPVAAPAPAKGGGEGGEGKGGFVFVKDFRVEEDGAAMAEARSLNDIRSALENLEDQLEFFHVSFTALLLNHPFFSPFFFVELIRTADVTKTVRFL